MGEPDFSGWATKANLKCSDGRVITPDAFKHQDKLKVPLLWSHGHKDVDNVLGHAILEHRPGEGIYTRAYFNDTDKAQNAKKMVKHGDIVAMSIWANQLVEKSKQVLHGMIKEVSLVLSGANPGALIDNISIKHDEYSDPEPTDEAIITTGEVIHLGDMKVEEKTDDAKGDENLEHKTMMEVYESLDEEQKAVVEHMVTTALAAGKAVEHSDDNKSDEGKKTEDDGKTSEDKTEGDLNHKEGTDMTTRNVFDQSDKSNKPEGDERIYLSHDELNEIKDNWKRGGSMRHAVEQYALAHGIENLELLFPDPKLLTTPEFDKRRMEWVKGVINGTRKSPMSRIKTMYADITHDAARARGYIKGNLKKEEFFGLVKRTTSPTTIYKKQKLDRDDILDATDLNVVAWMKAEMRMMLEEEIARAILIGDGRPVEDPANPGEPNPDKIKDPAGAQDGAGIRSILHDHELYAADVNVNIDDASSSYLEVVEGVMLAMELYKGSGMPDFYTTQKTLTKMLLTKDGFGRRLWRTKAELASEMGVNDIIAVEPMEDEEDLVGIIVNLSDYNVGTDSGGEVTLFDDFDLDYNQYKYLIETRFSGALVKIRSALKVKKTAAANVLVEPNELAFDPETNTIDYVAQTGVTYSLTPGGAALAADVVITEDTVVYARPAAGYYFADNINDEWLYEFQA